jgi:hypothetical protein
LKLTIGGNLNNTKLDALYINMFRLEQFDNLGFNTDDICKQALRMLEEGR